jgi:hypothetical protein
MVASFKMYVLEQKMQCPRATFDLHLNLKNRQHAIDDYGYGPLAPQEPNTEFWAKKAKMWNITAEQAKKAICGNCAAFDVSDKMRECINKGAPEGFENVTEKADLGYCVLLEFKCAGDRTCDAWLTNGPLDNKDVA